MPVKFTVNKKKYCLIHDGIQLIARNKWTLLVGPKFTVADCRSWSSGLMISSCIIKKHRVDTFTYLGCLALIMGSNFRTTSSRNWWLLFHNTWMVVKGVKILSNYIISSYSLSKQLHWDGSTSEESSPPVFLIDPVSTIALYSFSNILLTKYTI